MRVRRTAEGSLQMIFVMTMIITYSIIVIIIV